MVTQRSGQFSDVRRKRKLLQSLKQFARYNGPRRFGLNDGVSRLKQAIPENTVLTN